VPALEHERWSYPVRTLIDADPFVHGNDHVPWRERGLWPCSWITCPDVGPPPFVAAYRLRFTVDHAVTVRVHVAADERYELFLDGARIGRGSEQGAPDCWFFETYDLALDAGAHVLVARTWALGPRAALAQMSLRPGFLLAAEGAWLPLLGSGLASWEAKRIDGYRFVDPAPAHWRGANIAIDGNAYPWGVEHGVGAGWQPATTLERAVGRQIDWELPPRHLLQPATLPPMLDRAFASGSVRLVADVSSVETRPLAIRTADQHEDAAAWDALLQGGAPVMVPPRTVRRVIVDLEAYYCAYPELVTSGGAGSTVRVLWAESTFEQLKPIGGRKGQRDEIEGKYFTGIGDTFVSDGGPQRRFTTLWWQAGRFIEVVVATEAEPLTIEAVRLHETRYPLELESRFACDDHGIADLLPMLVRGMQMNAHEVFTDCPYYEQLMYAGDARIEALICYTMTRDDRLPRKAMRLFDVSRLASGLTYSRYPSRQLQIISSWSLWWVAMVRDYAMWRDDRAFVESLMPGVRATMEGFRRWFGNDGFLHAPEGWNTFDWVPHWEAGMPLDALDGVSGVLNWHYVYTLMVIADLEARLGEAELAARARRQAIALHDRLVHVFWDQRRGLLADDREHTSFSEHTQCLALLSGLLAPERREEIVHGLLHDQELARATYYFSHYLFETYRELGRLDAVLERLQEWDALRQLGLKTPLEQPEPSRSDCHAWSAHPLYHMFATMLGIRPAELGFRSVEIRPQLGSLNKVSGSLVHPHGAITVALVEEEGELRGSIDLPLGITGTLLWNGISRRLHPGRQDF
jgi:alpha-L-rhamnosidase